MTQDGRWQDVSTTGGNGPQRTPGTPVWGRRPRPGIPDRSSWSLPRTVGGGGKQHANKGCSEGELSLNAWQTGLGEMAASAFIPGFRSPPAAGWATNKDPDVGRCRKGRIVPAATGLRWTKGFRAALPSTGPQRQ